MRWAVIGVGGVGGYFGGKLAVAGEDVVFVARGAHLAAIARDGLRVDSIDGDFIVRPAQATDDVASVGPVDVVIVAVKTWQVAEVARSLQPLLGPHTCVLPLQNGIEAPDELAAVLGWDRVLGGLCGIFSFIEGPGHIRHTGFAPFVTLGEIDNRESERVEKIRSALTRAGVHATRPADIRAAMWMKLTRIGAAGALGAASRAPMGVLRDLPRTRRLLDEGIAEYVAVAGAEGIALPDDALSVAIETYASSPATATMSLQRDIMNGRPSELEAQVGVIVRKGERRGVPTPVIGTLYGALLPQERRARGELS